ncbi:hypothetical protein [Streptomyces sp. NPDC048277]|uniref:hypothetical protein n=1 Tax=Streptomyces sp. NPDC048277 TaxID=3155027 RepID=UPI0033C16406
MGDPGVPNGLNGPDSAGARVLLVVPTSWEWYFEPDKKNSITWYAERALRMADRISPGQGIDVYLYGQPKKGGDGTEVIRTSLDRASLREWTGDWATRPNAKQGLFADAVPASKVEKRLGAAGSPWYSLPLPAVRTVCKESAPRGEATLVLFWLDRMTQADDIVRCIAKEGGPAVFWQFFGDPGDINYTFWTKDALHRGGVLPQLRFHMGLRWRWRAFLRDFTRWSQAEKLR